MSKALDVRRDWGFLRWLNSRVATLLARPLTTARDPMAGFFALRRSTFENGRDFNPVGYKIGLELIVKCGCERWSRSPFTSRPPLRHEQADTEAAAPVISSTCAPLHFQVRRLDPVAAISGRGRARHDREIWRC